VHAAAFIFVRLQSWLSNFICLFHFMLFKCAFFWYVSSCVRVCIQIEWPVIRRLNGVCCLNALLIKLDWSGLVGTCHNQAQSHPSSTDLAAAWPPGHCRSLGASVPPPIPELTTTITPWTWSHNDPQRPRLLSNPGHNPRYDPSRWPLLKPPESCRNVAFRSQGKIGSWL